VHHRLFVPGLDVAQVVLRFEQRLADAGDVTVTKNSQASGNQALFDPVAFRVLVDEKSHQCLRDR
jgi:hypothetical protein